MGRLSTCLWFDGHAEQAVERYLSLFPRSRVLELQRWPDDAARAGQVLTIRFELDGTEYLALNGGPGVAHSPAMSMVAYCDTQEEVDRLWAALTADGGRESECGWLTDRFGISWQIVPRPGLALLFSPDKAGSRRAFAAMMTMRKLDIAALQRAHAGR